MSFKPGDWYLGSLEVFSALVPGGIAMFAFRGIGVYAGRVDPSWPAGTLDWAAFLVGSLILGYLAHPPAHVLNRLYDATYRKWKRRQGDRLLDIARGIAGAHVGPNDSLYAWARSEVAAASKDQAARIDLIEGISKMFRTLAFVAVIGTVVGLVLGAWPVAGVLALGAVLCFLVFSERRFAATKEVYQSLIRISQGRSVEAVPGAETAQ